MSVRGTPWTVPRRQLALDLRGEPVFTEDNFVVGDANLEAFALVSTWPDWPHPVAVLHGAPAAGKSHLARIWAGKAGAIVLPVHRIDAALSGLVSGAAEGQAYLVEDIGGRDLDQTGLFHLINHTFEVSGTLLLTAPHAPGRLGIGLADLVSRLRAASTVEIGLPDGDMLHSLLVKLFADRQIGLETKVAAFAVSQMERSFAEAVALVDAVDRLSLEQGRRITVPLIRRYFDEGELAG